MNFSGSGLLASEIAASRKPAAPAFRALVQLGDPGRRQRKARSLQELPGLALRETQIGRPDLGQLAVEPELVQPQRQITPGGEDRVHMLGEPLQQPGQLPERFRRGQLVQIIDDQERAIAMPGELGQNSVADGRCIKVGCRGQLVAVAWRTPRHPDGAENGQPELLRVLLIASHRHHGQPERVTRTICPGPQQGGLAAACRARDKRYLRFRRAIQ